MSFPFRYICDLLQDLDNGARSNKKEKVPSYRIIKTWFRNHRARLDNPTVEASAILSALLPERRTDRVYDIQAPRLQSIVGSALVLGKSRITELRRWSTPGLGVDLGDCVESILKSTPNPINKGDEVTTEEIDGILSVVAAGCRFSSPAVRSRFQSRGEPREDQNLGSIYVRLSARDAKWFTRLVLKNYQPVILDEQVVLRAYHVLLPQIMNVQSDLETAIAFLRHASQSLDQPSTIASELKPTLGIKVGRQPWHKARSIKHCSSMFGRRQVSCEQKMDGEYCQIHIDLRKPNSIQIFSKSGKDSTMDRQKLHGAIRGSLKLGKPDCPFKVGCILEGELVVYNIKDEKILPFHKIRKHVSRSGSFLGTAKDSQAHDYEQLMIVYYDVLMIDDESLLGVCHSERFERLKRIVTFRQGHAELVKREIISFSQRSAASMLRDAFARCIVSRGEGLVLKPDDPYFDFNIRHSQYVSCCIKLKKEYIQGFGDVGDFAVVGASYDAATARTYKISKLRWTHFFIGCLENRSIARAGSGKPRFMVTNVIEMSETLLSRVRTHCNTMGVPFDENNAFELNLRGIGNAKKPTVVFEKPFVFDMRCFSFDKEPNSDCWSMRFPMISKIHADRSYLDVISFDELQEEARKATDVPEEEDNQEMRQWVSKLKKADLLGTAVDVMSQEAVFNDKKTSRVRHWEERSTYRDIPEALDKSSSTDAPLLPAATDNVPYPAMPTPPRSSAMEIFSNSHVHTSGVAVESSPNRQKRPVEISTDTPNSKRRRNRSGVGTTVSVSLGSPTSKSRERQPLGAIDANSSSVNESSLAPDTRISSQDSTAFPATEQVIPSSVTGSFHKAGELPSSPPRPVSNQDQAQETDEEAVTPQKTALQRPIACALAGTRCFFANASILLAPFISNCSWITEDLLRGHGIFDYVTEPEMWKRKLRRTLSRSSSSAESGSSHCQVYAHRNMKKMRTRKICLVETRRYEATHMFLKRIEKAGLRRSNGEREWVTVFDWRILEDLANVEAGMRSKGPDPRRNNFVGIA